MKGLEIKFFLQRHRKIIACIAIVVFIGLFVLGLERIDINAIVRNSTIFGVIGTLLGAVVGGAFTLLGSIWVNSKQQKAVQNVRRKNVIYSPLYDELIDIQNRILKLNPYPTYILFEKGNQTMNPHPQFSAWGRIKADTRYLEVPDILIKKMEQLEASIRKYQSIRGKASDEIQAILNDVLRDNSMQVCNIRNIGDLISSDILSDNKIDIYHTAMEIGEKKQLDNHIREIINKQVYDKANSNQVVLDTREYYMDWLKIQRETINIIGLLIKLVIIKYEG